MGQNKVRGV
jgi:hypothetical protein